MSELRDSVQELLDYYDKLATKFGRIAEYKAVKQRVDRVRKAMQEPKQEEVENILDQIGEVNKILTEGPPICDACEERPPEICWVCAKDAGADKDGSSEEPHPTVLYLQVLLPQLKEQGDVTAVGWIEGALDEGEQPHTSPEAEERLAKIKELTEASDIMDAEEKKDEREGRRS